ncbi:GNAT family N-acetyltransferase [Paenibacillus wynnii]|uniref:GNAT family N-acetyltransferase n=1 Tax=Paenibacillus wynnii TaxID=268407 RepID=UPI001F0A1A5C|nr:GNAT family protein [Paenibacillus wynnii]
MNGEYFCAFNPDNAIIGYICIGDSARVTGGYVNGIYSSAKYVDIGLGLKPELTNKGFGYNFLTSSIQFLKDQYDIHEFQLVVASFNERAIKVYERVGFVKGVHFKSRIDDIEIDFVVMNYSS